MFQSRDPWEGTGWKPNTFNYYVYSLNNPISFKDPTGHCAGIASDPTFPGYDTECWDYLESEFCLGIDCGDIGWRYWLAENVIWRKSELILVKQSLVSAKSALQMIGISNWQATIPTLLQFTKIPGLRQGTYNAATHEITLYSGLFKESDITVVFSTLHELAHAIDHQATGPSYYSGTSLMGETFLRTAGASEFLAGETCFRGHTCNSIREGWADAFATFAVQKAGALAANWNMEWLINDELPFSQSRGWFGRRSRYYMDWDDIILVTDAMTDALLVTYCP